MKIFITGNAGSGKTTLSKILAKQIDLVPVGLDRFVWLPGWKRQSPEIIREQLNKVVVSENWLIEGVSSYVMEHADVIIFLDVPIYVAYWRAFKRTCKHLFKQRPELPDNCPELKNTKELIKIIWIFHKQVRSRVLMKVNQYKDIKVTYHIKNSKKSPIHK